jgi:hypothetical protein
MGMIFNGLTVESELGCIFDGAGLLREGSCRRCNSVEKCSRGHILSNFIRIVFVFDGLGEIYVVNKSSYDASGNSLRSKPERIER